MDSETKIRIKAIFDEVDNLLLLCRFAYKKKLYKEAIREGYDAFIFLTEIIGIENNLNMKEKKCHLEALNIMTEYRKKYDVTPDKIAFFESIRKTRNCVAHLENHYMEIEEDEKYKDIAKETIKNLSILSKKLLENKTF